PATLATIFARHGYQDYADILLRLPAESVSGFLTGFMDRLVYHKGRWGVIDWKTNDLGADASLYSEAALHHHIRHHHYLLQSVLYLVALRRFIGPSAPLVGAWVVYLRGISANTSQGILHVHPPEALLSELSGCFSVSC
ncbi:PD-(D/E)XK nuclease family protein, partial [Arthrospira platensis SPKY1]|nr:PD-(D/E)XK nuclease family protein [Arthrospira platensis SPKY1]